MFDIKKQLLWSKLKVGVVITAALMVILLTVFFAGSIETLFAPKIDIFAQIRDVRGLREGSPVWFAGVEVGSVKDISLNATYGTLVTLSINKSATEFIRRDSVATVMTMGLLGDKYVEISDGGNSLQAGLHPSSIIITLGSSETGIGRVDWSMPRASVLRIPSDTAWLILRH